MTDAVERVQRRARRWWLVTRVIVALVVGAVVATRFTHGIESAAILTVVFAALLLVGPRLVRRLRMTDEFHEPLGQRLRAHRAQRAAIRWQRAERRREEVERWEREHGFTPSDDDGGEYDPTGRGGLWQAIFASERDIEGRNGRRNEVESATTGSVTTSLDEHPAHGAGEDHPSGEVAGTPGRSSPTDVPRTLPRCLNNPSHSVSYASRWLHDDCEFCQAYKREGRKRKAPVVPLQAKAR